MTCRGWPLTTTVSLPSSTVSATVRLGIELLALLIEVGDLQPRAAADRARVRLQLADEQPQQRRLAGSVRPDQADAIAAQDPLRIVADDRHAAERLADVFRLEHQPARRLGWRRSPSGPGRCARAGRRAPRAAPSVAFTRPSLRVRRALTPWRSQASSCASFLSSRSSSRASFVERGGLLLEVRGVAAGPRGQAAAIELDDARRQRGEERAVVGDEQQRAGVPAQVLLEPADGVDVEVIGRLVEQQQIRLRTPAPCRAARGGASRRTARASAGRRAARAATRPARPSARAASRPVLRAGAAAPRAARAPPALVGHAAIAAW